MKHYTYVLFDLPYLYPKGTRIIGFQVLGNSASVNRLFLIRSDEIFLQLHQNMTLD